MNYELKKTRGHYVPDISALGNLSYTDVVGAGAFSFATCFYHAYLCDLLRFAILSLFSYLQLRIYLNDLCRIHISYLVLILVLINSLNFSVPVSLETLKYFICSAVFCVRIYFIIFLKRICSG